MNNGGGWRIENGEWEIGNCRLNLGNCEAITEVDGRAVAKGDGGLIGRESNFKVKL